MKEKSVRLPIVAESEIEVLAQELRLAFITNKVLLEDFKRPLKKYSDDSTISIFELSRIFQKKLPNLKKDSIVKLCRYVVEPRESPEVEFKELNEEIVEKVFPELLKLLDKCSLIDTDEALQLRADIESVTSSDISRKQRSA